MDVSSSRARWRWSPARPASAWRRRGGWPKAAPRSSHAGSMRRPTRALDAESQRAAAGAWSAQTDVSLPDEVGTPWRGVARFGGLDIIVNAAAVHPFGTVVTTDSETWQRRMARQRRLDLPHRAFRHPRNDQARRRRHRQHLLGARASPVSRTSRPTSRPRARSTR